MTMPNFLILGAAKSGTTALYHYLINHPEIYMSPKKETNFFTFEGQKASFRGPGDNALNNASITELGLYKALFNKVKNEKAIGEASPLYLYDKDTPKKIKKHIPNAKLIIMLRNPADRAFSSYLHCLRDGREEYKSFEMALDQETFRIKNNWGLIWHYKNAGLYYEQLRRYYQEFDSSNIRIYLYDDFLNQTTNILKDIFDFLEIDTSFIPDVSVKHNKSGIPNSKVVQRLLYYPNIGKSVLKPFLPKRFRMNLKTKVLNKNLTKPKMSYKTRNELIDYFYEDILNSQKEFNLDLSKWVIKDKIH